MSRGLGNLQREILSTLDDAKRCAPLCTCDCGGADREHLHVRYHGRCIDLPADVYDMRASLRFLGCAKGQVDTGLTLRKSTIVKPNFASSFCRAIRGLVETGYLSQWSSPIHRPGPEGGSWWPNRRFVKRTEKAELYPKFPPMYDAYGRFREFERRESAESNARIERFMKAIKPAFCR
jgi:hypothetical protein